MWTTGRRTSSRRTCADDRGAVAIIVAVFVLVAMVLLAFVIDRGRIYVVQSQLQNAVDAGALAGAPELCVGTTAAQLAVDYAENNGATPGQILVDATGADGDFRFINVRTFQTVDLFFGPFVNTQSANVAVQATASQECRVTYRFVAVNSFEIEGGGADFTQDPIWAGWCFSANKGFFGIVTVTNPAVAPYTVPCGSGANPPPPIDNGHTNPIQDVATPVYAQTPRTAASFAAEIGVPGIITATEADSSRYTGECKDAKSATWSIGQAIDCTGTGSSNALDVPSDSYTGVIIAQGDINLPNSGTMTNALIYSREGSVRIPAGLNIGANTIVYAPAAGTDVTNTGGGSSGTAGSLNGVVIADSIRITGGHETSSGGTSGFGPGDIALVK